MSEGIVKETRNKKEIVTALVAEEDQRILFKDSINTLFEKCFGPDYKTYPIYWRDVDDENLNVYQYVIHLFNDNPSMILYAEMVKNSSTAKKRKVYAGLISKIRDTYDDDVRVFIPYDEKYGRKNIKLLKNELKKAGIECVVSQNPLEESRFYQTSKLFSDIFSYYENELGYFDNIESNGKPDLVSYFIGLKKPRGKYNHDANS